MAVGGCEFMGIGSRLVHNSDYRIQLLIQCLHVVWLKCKIAYASKGPKTIGNLHVYTSRLY